ncbi:hypothetical protein IWW54_005741, partial [Coemansia sp. RSA 2705]
DAAAGWRTGIDVAVRVGPRGPHSQLVAAQRSTDGVAGAAVEYRNPTGSAVPVW